MAKKHTKVATLYGPVDITLNTCDGPDCTTCVLDQYMVGWFELAPKGMSAATMGTSVGLDPLDFCSFECLKRAVDLMTG